MYTVFLPVGDDRTMELRCSTIKELADLLDLYGLKPSSTATTAAHVGEAMPSTAEAPKAAPVAASSLTEQRLPFVRRALLRLGSPAGPKEIADALREDQDFAMNASDWPQAVRYILRNNKDVFVRGEKGWWVKGEQPTGSVQGSLMDEDGGS